MTGDIDDGKQQITDFLCNAIRSFTGIGRVCDFARFFGNFIQNRPHIRPIEPDPSCPFL